MCTRKRQPKVIVHDIRKWICSKANLQENEGNTVQVDGIERKKIHNIKSGR